MLLYLKKNVFKQSNLSIYRLFFSVNWYCCLRCLGCLRCEERCTFIKLCFILSSSLFFSTSISCFTFCTMSSYIKNIMRSYLTFCTMSSYINEVIHQNIRMLDIKTQRCHISEQGVITKFQGVIYQNKNKTRNHIKFGYFDVM